MSIEGSQTEFDFSEFETSVTVETEDRVIEAIAASIGHLRDQIDDDTLEGSSEMSRAVTHSERISRGTSSTQSR